MSSLDADVIELGSSDEEAKAPAPKKKKPMPMVVIPDKFPGVTIKPAKPQKRINPVSFANTTIGKDRVTVTKVNSSNHLSNPFASKNIINGKPTISKQFVRKLPALPIVNPSLTVTPKLKTGKITVANVPLKVAQGISTAAKVIRMLPKGGLPPGITVKRTTPLKVGLKPCMRLNPTSLQVTKKTASKTKEMVCVELDDDESTPPSSGPQWYLRPEDQDQSAKSDQLNKSGDKSPDPVQSKETSTAIGKQTDTSNMEQQNNKEPEPHYIEITIEDSPAKSQTKSKRTCEVSEMAITIDDSPVKTVAIKTAPTIGSDDETTPKEKHSKKKLNYPEGDKKVVEIEIELTPVNKPSNQDKDQLNTDKVPIEVLEVEDSPLKPVERLQTSTPKKKTQPKPQLQLNVNKSISNSKPEQSSNGKKSPPSTPGEFHPIYQSFIDLCFQLENSDDMNKIVEKKIKAYYKQVPKEYTESEIFTDMVASKIIAMKVGPEKMYLYIKDVVDELNMQRKIAKSQPAKKVDTVNEEQEKFLYGEESEFDAKRQRQIRKLEKTLKKLHRAIQKLEEQEVDFEDEEDSVYLLTESDAPKDQVIEKSELLKRYKERMIRVHAKLCQLTNTKMPSEPRVHIDARPGRPRGPAKRLEKWINKKVPIGTPLPFPDFHDVLRCVRDANQDDDLGWNEADIMEEARDLFTRCGKKLQRRRQENEWRLAVSRIQSEIDPAEESEELKKKLDDNRRVASKKESEVLNKYADRQNQLNLEAVEIEDKEADESPIESDDEDAPEESASLEDKEKRKQRLKRLLQERNKNGTGDKKTTIVETQDNHKQIESTVDKVIEAAECDNSQVQNKEKDSPTSNENNEVVSKSNDNEDPLEIINAEDNRKPDNENIHSLSDDSKQLDSDIDELHLLQKLHSDVVDSSTLESSDSESPIAISDAISSGDNKKRESDVISIENSSFSESEKNNEQEFEFASSAQNKIVTESVNFQMEIECSEAGVEKKSNKSNNDEYSESVENILLASSDDEKNENPCYDPLANDQTTDKNTKEQEHSPDNPDILDSSSIESIVMTMPKSITKETDAASAEITSITSSETGDEEVTKVVETTSTNSKETDVADTPKTEINVKHADECVIEENVSNEVKKVAVHSVEITSNDIASSTRDESMMSLGEENETSIVNNTQDNETVPIANVETTDAIILKETNDTHNDETVSDTKILVEVEVGQQITKITSDLTEIISGDSRHTKSQEAMEVDDDNT